MKAPILMGIQVEMAWLKHKVVYIFTFQNLFQRHFHGLTRCTHSLFHCCTPAATSATLYLNTTPSGITPTGVKQSFVHKKDSVQKEDLVAIVATIS